jgi:hypothetical protein
MGPEYYQVFEGDVRVDYFDGLPYWMNEYGEYLRLDPAVYGYIDPYGYLTFPTSPALRDQGQESSGGGCGCGRNLMLLLIAIASFVGGREFINQSLTGRGRDYDIKIVDGTEVIEDLQEPGSSSDGELLLPTVEPLIAEEQGKSLNIPYLYPAVRELEDEIIDFGGHFGVDPNLVAIIILYESGGDSSNDQNLIDVGVGQMTDVAMQTVNNDTTPEERAYVGLPGGRYATMEDIRWNKTIATGYTTLLLRYYERVYNLDDSTVLARMYNGGPSGLNGPTGPLNEMYANHVGGLVDQLEYGLNGPIIQELFASGRIASP